MKEIFELLEDKEKKILGLVCVLLAVALLFLVLISLPQRRNYFFSLSSITAKQKDFQQLNKETQEKKEAWQSWQEASRDIEELKSRYFYDDKEGLRQLRLDLEQLFKEATMADVSPIKYTYHEIKKEKIKRVNVSFNLRGSYLVMKKFINSVEMFPKFLVIEKIDFVDIDSIRGELKLRVILAGYYET